MGRAHVRFVEADAKPLNRRRYFWIRVARQERFPADIAQMPHSARKGAGRELLSDRALREPNPRRPFHLPRARDPAAAEHAGRPKRAPWPGMAEPVDHRTAGRGTCSAELRSR